MKNRKSRYLSNFKITQIPKLVTDKENGLINMSDKQIPDNVTNILSLDGKFAFNYNERTFSVFKIITNIEYNVM